MGGLVADLARRLPEGVVRLGRRVSRLDRAGDSWRVVTDGGAHDVDAVIVALPSHAAAALLADIDPTLAGALAAIEYASSATVTLGHRSADLPRGLAGFGFVVPSTERRAILACSYASRKFAGRAPEGHELLRAFVGGALRPELVELDDGHLVATVEAELAELLGVTARPLLARVHRHRRAMPQYHVGHEARAAAIEARAAALPGLALAGAAYHGVGVPDCVRSGEAAAEALLDPRQPENAAR
jgi:protoporphyrinogen/coproporphyrinogen III oxidase